MQPSAIRAATEAAESAQQDDPVLKACEQAVIDLKAQRAVNDQLQEKLAGQEIIIGALRTANAALAEAIEKRKEADVKTGEIEASYERSLKLASDRIADLEKQVKALKSERKWFGFLGFVAGAAIAGGR